MASGDPFMIKHEAGSGTSWSYTATTDLVITCYGIESAVIQQNWVNTTSGVYSYLPNGNSTQVNASNLNKVVLTSGSTITAGVDNDVNIYGLYIGGFEL